MNVTVAFPLDEGEASIPDGYAATIECQWNWAGGEALGTSVVNLFQWAGRNLYFLRCFSGKTRELSIAEMHDWFNAECNGRLF